MAYIKQTNKQKQERTAERTESQTVIESGCFIEPYFFKVSMFLRPGNDFFHIRFLSIFFFFFLFFSFLSLILTSHLPAPESGQHPPHSLQEASPGSRGLRDARLRRSGRLLSISGSAGRPRPHVVEGGSKTTVEIAVG